MPEAARVGWKQLCRALPICTLLVSLGLGLRAFHYLRDPSIWHDEAALVVNVIQKNFTQLLGPLLLAEDGPPLFLWIERAVVLSLADSTLALRLVPFLASCLTVLLFVPLARKVLRPEAVPWAIVLMIGSDKLLGHSCEAKPYIVDVAVAMAIATLFCASEAWPLGRRIVCFTALAPFFIFLSFPGCFVCGGLLVALLPSVRRSRRWPVWLGYGLLTCAVFGSFLLLLEGPVKAQRVSAIVEDFQRMHQFPPLSQPWRVPIWTFFSSLEVARYCCHPVGQVLVVFGIVGVASLWKRGKRAKIALLGIPIALPLLASFGEGYPFGGCRVIAYTAPAVILFIAEGVPLVLSWMSHRARLGAALLVGLILAVPVTSLYRVAVPWPRADSAGASSYVLSRRQVADAVTGNDWEFLYYFRDLPTAYTPITELHADCIQRLWVVLKGPAEDRCAIVANSFPQPSWRLLDSREFEYATVYLLARNGSEAKTDLAAAAPHMKE